MEFVNGLPNWAAGSLFIVIISAFSCLGVFSVRRRYHHTALAKHNDTAGVVFAVVGTLYTVMLAFVVVIVWEAMGTAGDRAAAEAGTLGDLLRDSAFLAQPLRGELQKDLQAYAQTVINDEWPTMASGKSSDKVWSVLTETFRTFSRFEPTTPREINIHAEMLRGLNDLSAQRRLRLLSSQDKVPDLMWDVLLIGGIITVAFSCFLGVENSGFHFLMTVALATMMALSLFLIYAIDSPYEGAISVGPDAMHLIINQHKDLSFDR